MRKAQRSVKAFHRKFGHTSPDHIALASPKDLKLRQDLIKEEVGELFEAYEGRYVTDIAHESADAIIVILGGCVAMGIEMAPVFEAVMKANMDKIPNGRHAKPIKGRGWMKADVASVLCDQMTISPFRRWLRRLLPWGG